MRWQGGRDANQGNFIHLLHHQEATTELMNFLYV
jgi:hypothetical protein